MRTGDIRQVAIVGSGFEAWLAAAVLARELAPGLERLTVWPSAAPAPAFDYWYALAPSNPTDCLRSLKISDLQLLKEHDGSFALGARYGDQILPFGPVGLSLAGAGFCHHWVAARKDRGTDDFFAFSPAAGAIHAGVFAPPVDRNAIESLQHEMARLVDPVSLTGALKSRALVLGAAEADAPLHGVTRGSDGAIEGLRDAHGHEMTADLYIDASGMARVLGQDHLSWQPAPGSCRWSLAEPVIEARQVGEPCYSFLPDDRGWTVKYPLRTRTARLRVEVDESSTGFLPGHAAQPWYGNCVSVGQAACLAPPLLPHPTSLLHQSLRRLVDLLPGARCAAPETWEFNQLFHRDAGDCQRLMSLYELRRRHGRLSADGMEDTELARRVALFAKRGWVMPEDGTLVTDDDWTASLMACGVVPAQPAPLAGRLTDGEREARLAQLRQRINQVLAEFPALDQYLAAALSAEPREVAGG
ncbi:MAG: tryptophan 7-halogenase [Pseudomonadota bacterium]